MTVRYSKYGMKVIDSGANYGSNSSFTMFCGDQNANYDIVQANCRFTGANTNQWLFSRMRAGLSSYKNIMYRAQGAGTSSSYGSYNSTLWATYWRNSNGGSYSYAQFTIKNMNSDSNPFGDTTIFCRYMLLCTVNNVANNFRNDYTFVRQKDTGTPDKIQMYFQNGNVTGYEYKVYALGSSD